jgi:hypothetical protein
MGKDLPLLFSTQRDGYSLSTLYSRARGNGATLLVVLDESQSVFGGFASRDWSGAEFGPGGGPPAGAGGHFARGSVGYLPSPGRGRAGENWFGSGDAFLFSLRPGFAVVMIGTNDVERVSPEDYERNLREILRRVEARSVVPVLSTIPDHRGTPEFTARSRAFNGIIRRVATALHIPLLDYHAALAALPNAGLSDDNIHPSAYVENGDTRAGVFTPAGLRHGYNVRNLTLLLMLERLIETVGARA